MKETRFSLTGNLGYRFRMDGPLLLQPEVGTTATLYLPNLLRDLPAFASSSDHTGYFLQPYVGGSFFVNHNRFAAFGAVPSTGTPNLGLSAHAGLAFSEAESTNPAQSDTDSSQNHNHHFRSLWTYRVGARLEHEFLNPSQTTLGPEVTLQLAFGPATPTQWIGGATVYLGWNLFGTSSNPSDLSIYAFFGKQI